jgi:penicillin-binding protein 1C
MRARRAKRATPVTQRLLVRSLRIAVLTVCAAIAAAAAWFFFPQDVQSFATVRAQWTPSDAYLLDRKGEVIAQQRIDFHIRRLEWTPLESVSPALTSAIIDGEDRRFWQHNGVDWASLLGALRDNGVAQRRRGASTISMQVVALLDPSVRAGSTSGAWYRKVLQLRLARSLEAHWTKRGILEAYLNLLGFRGELQGIAAASQVLAGKSPSGLTVPESLVLAALLPAPNASIERTVSRACARADARQLHVACTDIQTAARDILSSRPAIEGLLSESQRSRSPQSPGGWREAGKPLSLGRLGAAGRQGPQTTPGALAKAEAPQLARALLTKPGERITTTLDASLQRLATNTLRNHLAQLTNRNVRDGAILIVDNDTGDVLAYVASASATSRSKQVDGIRAHRQAGSTLKPFLYELALENRYITAASLLNDAPITLDTASGNYLPQNYDRDFKGLVTVRTALASSLNVPAVRTLVLTGVEPFRERLYRVGYATITQPGDFYGYSLALGSAEVSLWEQVQAYRTLARGGRFSPIKVLPTEAKPDELLLSEPATYIVTSMLSDRAARVVTFGLDNHLNTPFWSAVKTGTSKDMRDNWCIGFSRRFTVGVWVGNFEGDAMHDVSGVTGAAPVWQEIMLALHARLPSTPPEAPQGVVTQLAKFSPAIEPPRNELFLSAEPTTTVRAAEEIARIASPANGVVIALDPDIPARLQRVPLSTRGTDDRMVLRLNDKVLGPADQNVMWIPERGSYTLALEDGAGRTLDSARFLVR